MRRYAVVCRAKPRSSNDVSDTHDFGTACWIVTLHARGVLDPVELVLGSAVRKRPTARGWGHGFGHRRFHPYKVVRTLSSGRRALCLLVSCRASRRAKDYRSKYRSVFDA
jgi:hypothetical protein